MSKCTINSRFDTEFKVAIVGCGNVGSSAAYAMLLDGTPSEIILYDRHLEKAQGLQLDFEHSLSLLEYTKITAADHIDQLAGSDLVVITAGARQKEGETRLDLINKNKAIFQDIIPRIAKAAPDSILLIVSNPVDVLTHEALKLSKFPTNRVFGSGTMLDTARLRFHISEKLCLNPKSIHAYVLGEHGDTSFPVYSSANIAGKPITSFAGFTPEIATQCYTETKEAAYRIIHDLGYTCYSIGVVITQIMHHIAHNSRVTLPLSTLLKNYHGHSDVCLSVPCVLDNSGISETIEVPLDKKELKLLDKSVETLKSYL